MTFSEQEREIIKQLKDYCEGSYYISIGKFLSDKILKEDTALIGYLDRDYPNAYFCYRTENFNEEEQKKAYFDTLIALSLLLKLSDEGYLSLLLGNEDPVNSPGMYLLHQCKRTPQDIITLEKVYCYSCYLMTTDKQEKIRIDDDKWYLKDDVLYRSIVINKRLNVYDLLDSFVRIEQKLIELVENEFKSLDEIQLEEAKKQTESAKEQSEEAKKQTDFARKQSEEAHTQTWLSLTAVILSLVSVIISGYQQLEKNDKSATHGSTQYEECNHTDSALFNSNDSINSIEVQSIASDSSLVKTSNALDTDSI